eukprot:2981698-Pleurochrysis_carterae.AAC.1
MRQGLESTAARSAPAWMQERELRKGSVRHSGVKGGRSYWPSTTGADPVASFNCKAVGSQQVVTALQVLGARGIAAQ